MKIVQINSFCGVGSTGRIAVDISEKLNEEGIENYIFYGVGKSDCINSIKFAEQFNLRMHQIGTRILGKHGFYSKNATKKLIKKIKKINPDIIHLHNIHGHYLNVEILFEFLAKSDVKVVWTLHDCWSFTGHCAHFDYVGCMKWKNECSNCPQLKEYPKSLIFDRSRESFQDKKRLFSKINEMVIVTPSCWLHSVVSESFLKNYTIKVINNGVDLRRFKFKPSEFRKKYNIENKFIILGVASFWGNRKGLQYFVELAKSIKEDESVVLVGLSKKQQKKLPKNIICIPSIDSIDELAEIYSAADVFVNPTLEEVLGMTNIESLACGTPVITFDSGGSPETIDQDTGIIVGKGNINELKKAIEIVKKNGKEIYHENCIKRAREQFDKEEKYSKYIELYKQTI